MTVLTRLLFALLPLLFVAPVAAQEKTEEEKKEEEKKKKKKPPPPIRIEKVRLGLPSGGSDDHRARQGAWNPVYVDLVAGLDDIGQGDYELVGETSDLESQTLFTSTVPAIAAEQTRRAITYYRPVDRNGRLTVTLKKRTGSTVQTINADPRVGAVLEPQEFLYLGIGSPLTGLRLIGKTNQRAGKVLFDQPGEVDPDAEPVPSLASITRASEMPTRWYGYQGADLIVLSTFKDTFVQELRQNEPALAALGEWVRRGGRLVLSVGRNVQTVRELLPRMGLADFKLEKKEVVTTLTGLGTWAGNAGVLEARPQDSMEVARITVRDGVVPLATDTRDGTTWPLLTISTAGTGQILLVAFDLESPAFTRWSGGHRGFWEQVRKEMIYQKDDQNFGGRHENRSEMAANLQRGLESFSEVPVISFGWVAFFILIYIIIVGPLDYWFLKKVVKRLELTWVTFPLVVLIVSVAAYFTAYKLKGNHMRINKVDVVDINLRDGEVQGTTWLALFSPRVQAYTVGIAPSPEWVGGAKEDEDFGALVTTMNAPDSSTDRPVSQSLFRRPYSYAEDARGLKGVPVPVWASRSFTASWRAKVEPNKLVELKDVGPSRDGERLIGTLTSHLPVELSEVSLLYQGAVYKLDKLPAGETYSIEAARIPFRGKRDDAMNPQAWVDEPFMHVVSQKAPRPRTEDPPVGMKRGRKPGFEEGMDVDMRNFHANALMKRLLFFTQADQQSRNNSGLRTLDQSWRLRGVHAVVPREETRFLDEAILIGRIVQTPATAETVTISGTSPTRLWLGTLPGDGNREALQGFLGQDTYVRIYIPISTK
jgi:hypothetical protein